MQNSAHQSKPKSSKKQPPSKAWLEQKAAKLKNLATRGWKLQSDFLRNAREQGQVLAEVRKRLKQTSLPFDTWVKENTDIGVSTAYLWIDVAEWWDDLQEPLKNSNTLETSLRQIRDHIRDLRQGQGIGKPGSGRKQATPEEAGTAFQETASPDNEPSTILTKSTSVDQEKKWEAAIQEAGQQNAAKKSERQEPLYTISAISQNSKDVEPIKRLLPSPITERSKGVFTVKGWIHKNEISRFMMLLGKVLEKKTPDDLRLSVVWRMTK